jgi:glycosyltransferase involved in cell wall biosynthesis
MALVTAMGPGGAAFDAGTPYATRRMRLGGRLAGRPAFVGEALDGAALLRGALAMGDAGCYLAGEVMPAAFAAAAAAMLKRRRFGVILHDEPLLGAGALESRLRKWVLSHAACFIVSSSFPERRIREVVGERPIFVAPPGIDVDRFRPGEADGDVLDRFGVKDGSYILSVGRLKRYKNVQAVIEAIAELGEDGPCLVIVGEGPRRAALEATAAKSGVAGRVRFAGRVETGELRELYRGAAGFIFPSKRMCGRQHEGIGMAALEAAACGAPVAASGHTSAGDFVTDGETGVIFDPEEPGEVTRAVRTLWNDRFCTRQMGKLLSERVRADYTWANTARVVAEAVDYLVGRSS